MQLTMTINYIEENGKARYEYEVESSDPVSVPLMLGVLQVIGGLVSETEEPIDAKTAIEAYFQP